MGDTAEVQRRYRGDIALVGGDQQHLGRDGGEEK